MTVGGGQWMVENSNLTKVGEIVLLDELVSMGHSVGTKNEFQRSCAAETALSVVVELHLGGRWTSNAKDPCDPLQHINFVL